MIQQSHSWAYIWENHIQKDTCTFMFMAAMHSSHDMETAYLSIDRGAVKEDVAQVLLYHKHYSAMKKNVICRNKYGLRDHHTK